MWKNSKLTTYQILILSFIALSTVGSLILALPISLQAGIDVPFFDHFATSISLVCVSGMAALSIGDTYSLFGQTIALILIQIGGLGVITLINAGLYTLRRKIPLREQYLMQESLNRDTNTNFLDFMRSIYLFTFIAEFLGVLIICIDFIPRYGIGRGIFNAIFLAVGSFNNAGLHNLESDSLINFNNNPLILLTVCVLIILGGIGFTVWFELRERVIRYINEKPRHFKIAFQHLSMHTRLVLTMTIILITIGTSLTWISESQNPLTMQNMSLPMQVINSFFKAVNARTAGFTSVHYVNLTPFSKFISMVQTIIGGAPGGTAGGIKVTTFAILMLLIRSELNSYSEVIYHRRTIPARLVKRAVLITLCFIILLVIGYSILLITHPHLNELDLLFEVVNALGTAGISLDLTAQLSTLGHIVLIILMIAGRVGPITLLVGLLEHKHLEVNYAKADIYIG